MLPSLVIILLLIVIYLNYNKKTNFTNQIINIALIVLVMTFTYSHLKKAQLMENSIISEEAINRSSLNNKSNTTEPFDNDINKSDPYYSGMSNDDINALESEAEEINIMSSSYNEDDNDNEDEDEDKFQNTNSLDNNLKKGELITQKDIKGAGNIFKPTLIVNDGEKEKSISYKMGNNDTPKNLISYRNYQTPEGDLYGDGAENDENDPYYDSSTNYSNNKLINQRSSLGDDIFNKNEKQVRKARLAARRQEYEREASEIRNKSKCMDMPGVQGSSCPYDVTEAEKASLKGKDKGKQYYPGYSFMPPETWNVPQDRVPVCVPDKWNKRPSAVFDRGTPTNVLELDENGNMATNEDDVHFTNVGSILPKFKYEQL